MSRSKKQISAGLTTKSAAAEVTAVQDYLKRFGYLGEAPGGGTYETVDIYEDFQREAIRVIDASAVQMNASSTKPSSTVSSSRIP